MAEVPGDTFDDEPTSPWVPTPAIDETELECVHGNEPTEPAFPGMDPLTKAEESAAKVRAAIAKLPELPTGSRWKGRR